MSASKEYIIQFDRLVAYKGKDKEVSIPEGVTTIGRRAFYFNKQIETVTLPASVVTVEQEAFEYCTNLQRIVIHGRIKSAGKNAFGSFYQKEDLELSVYSAVPIGSFAKSAQETALSAFSRRFQEFEQTSEVFQDNLQFIGKHLKQPCAYGGKLFFSYLVDNKDLRHAVLNVGTIPAREVDWLVGKIQEEDNTEFVTELLEYKNRLLSDDRIQKSLESSKVHAEKKVFSGELTATDWKKVLKFSYESGNVVIKEVNIKEPIIELPDRIGAKPVRIIGSRAFAYNMKKGQTELWFPEKIVIPEGVEEIRPWAFFVLDNAEIFFPGTLKKLPEDCFCAVKDLILHIPAAIQEIPDELYCDSNEVAIKTICAPSGSVAEQYAIEHGIPFEAE